MASEAKAIAEAVNDEYAADLLMEIYDHELPDVVADLVEKYQSLPQSRPPFMWKWVHKLAPHNTLPCVPSKFADDVPTDKTLLILFTTLLDDILEKEQDQKTFSAAATAPFPHRGPAKEQDGYDRDYVEFTHRVWDTLEKRLTRAPNYNSYLDLLRYDVQQAINAIEYTDLIIRNPDVATVHDLEQYEAHNMVMFGYADIDLMHSDLAVQEDLSSLRKAIWHAQQMTRIGNWVSTWRLELANGDLSSGVVIYALENDIISLSDLEADDPREDQPIDDIINSIDQADVEDVFLKRWDTHFDAIRQCNEDLTSFDLSPFVNGLKEVLRYHIASEGLK